MNRIAYCYYYHITIIIHESDDLGSPQSDESEMLSGPVG